MELTIVIDTPKKIYWCDFPGCERNFVRQDLCTRHRERHTARGSHLQRKDNNSHDHDERPPLAAAVDANQDQKDTSYRPSTGGHASSTSISTIPPAPFMKGHETRPMASQSPVAARMPEPYQTSSSSATPSGSHIKSPQSISTAGGSDYATNMTSMKRSNSDEQYSR